MSAASARRWAAAIAVVPALYAIGPRPARAGGANPSVDLRVRRLPAPVPASLIMRPAAARAIALAANEDLLDAEDTDGEVALATDYRPLPRDLRDLEERVIFHVNLGYGIASGPTSGELDRSGYAPGEVETPGGEAFIDQRQYVLGDAVLGSRGVLLPSLSTYFLSQFKYDIDGASSFGSLPDVYDTRGGRALLVRAGYAEIEGLGPAEGPLSHLYVRGGRQFRHGTSAFVTSFDGATAGYRDRRVDASGFVGRRVSLFFDDDPGLLAGGGLVVRGREAFGAPVDLAGDYLHFDGGEAGVARQLVELSARVRDLPFVERVSARGRVVDLGDGLALGRVGLEVLVPIAPALPRLTGEVVYQTADDFAYDFLGATPTDVVAAPTQLGIALEPPTDSVLLGGKADWRVTPAIELYLFGRINLAIEEPTSTAQQTWNEAGAAASWTDGPLSASAQVKARRFLVESEENDPGGAFGDTSGSGVSAFRELAGEARYRFPVLRSSAAVGGYYRVYDVETPYAKVRDDGRAGGRAEVDLWPAKYTRLKAAGELAEPSPSFAAELGTLVSVRLVLEAIF